MFVKILKFYGNLNLRIAKVQQEMTSKGNDFSL